MTQQRCSPSTIPNYSRHGISSKPGRQDLKQHRDRNRNRHRTLAHKLRNNRHSGHRAHFDCRLSATTTQSARDRKSRTPQIWTNRPAYKRTHTRANPASFNTREPAAPAPHLAVACNCSPVHGSAPLRSASPLTRILAANPFDATRQLNALGTAPFYSAARAESPQPLFRSGRSLRLRTIISNRLSLSPLPLCHGFSSPPFRREARPSLIFSEADVVCSLRTLCPASLPSSGCPAHSFLAAAHKVRQHCLRKNLAAKAAPSLTLPDLKRLLMIVRWNSLPSSLTAASRPPSKSCAGQNRRFSLTTFARRSASSRRRYVRSIRQPEHTHTHQPFVFGYGR